MIKPNLIELKKILQFTGPLCTNSHLDVRISYYDELTKLHLLMVKYGIKEFYMDFLKNNNQLNDISEYGDVFWNVQKNLSDIIKALGLKHIKIKSGPMIFRPSEFIDNSLLAKMALKFRTGKEIWIYRDDAGCSEVENGHLDMRSIGRLLDYPDCCIDWMIDTKTSFLEDCYSYYWNKIGIQNVGEQIQFMTTYFESDLIPNYYERMYEIKKMNLVGTIKLFPFVYHQACKNCLKNTNSPTAKLNHKYEEFSMSIGKNFHDKIIYESRKIIRYTIRNISKKPKDTEC